MRRDRFFLIRISGVISCANSGAASGALRRNWICTICAALKRALRCVRVIHGKGWGSPDGQPVLKAKVRLWLAQIEDVIAFCPARLQHGGEGVVIVLLRSPRNAR